MTPWQCGRCGVMILAGSRHFRRVDGEYVECAERPVQTVPPGKVAYEIVLTQDAPGFMSRGGQRQRRIKVLGYPVGPLGVRFRYEEKPEGWLIDHRATGYTACGNTLIPNRVTALELARRLAAIPGWSDDPEWRPTPDMAQKCRKILSEKLSLPLPPLIPVDMSDNQ